MALLDEVLSELSAYMRLRGEFVGYLGEPDPQPLPSAAPPPAPSVRRHPAPLPGQVPSPAEPPAPLAEEQNAPRKPAPYDHPGGGWQGRNVA